MSTLSHGTAPGADAPEGQAYQRTRSAAARRWQALGIAAVLEGGVLTGLLFLLRSAPVPTPPAIIALRIEAPPVAEETHPAPPKPLPKIPPPHIDPPKPQVVLPRSSPPLTPPQSVVPTPVLPPTVIAPPDGPNPTVTRTADVAPVATPLAASLAEMPVAPAPAPPPVENGDITRTYNAKLSAAVQAAFVVPSVARNMGFRGRARVEFGLRDGVVSALRIVQSSGLSAVDKAALAAVQTAAFPAPPSSLQGKDGTYAIWVACY